MDNLLVKHEGSAAPMTFSHDAASRPVSFLQGSGVTTYSWANRGTVFQEARPDGVVTTFQQADIRNQLVYAQLSSGTNSSYSYDSDGMRLRTFEGSVWSTMVWDQGDYLAVNRSGADDSLFVLMDGEVLGEILGSEARDYLADPLGSVRGGFDSSQDLQDAMSYWPYGEPLPSSRTWGTLFWLGTLGYYQDPGSRVYVRARSYSSNSASWLQVDPLWPREPGFGYVSGMPVTLVDIFGQVPVIWLPFLETPVRGAPTQGPSPTPPVVLPPVPPRPVPAISLGGGALIAGGAIALIDLINWGCTGKTGPITGIGESIGKFFHPDPVGEDSVSPGKVRNPKACSEAELIRRQQAVDAACKTKAGRDRVFDCFRFKGKDLIACRRELKKCIDARNKGM